jgi:hypothetical protein
MVGTTADSSALVGSGRDVKANTDVAPTNQFLLDTAKRLEPTLFLVVSSDGKDETASKKAVMTTQ